MRYLISFLAFAIGVGCTKQQAPAIKTSVGQLAEANVAGKSLTVQTATTYISKDTKLLLAAGSKLEKDDQSTHHDQLSINLKEGLVIIETPGSEPSEKIIINVNNAPIETRIVAPGEDSIVGINSHGECFVFKRRAIVVDIDQFGVVRAPVSILSENGLSSPPRYVDITAEAKERWKAVYEAFNGNKDQITQIFPFSIK